MTFPSGIAQALDPLRLRLLVEVRRRGSIVAAAQACQIAQPSATKHLKTLEAALGERLVERHGRASRLTGAGEVVADHAARVLDTLTAMDEELDALRGARRGTLALAASTTPGTYVLPRILRCFADRHPQVEVEVAIGPSRWVVERVTRRDVQLGLAGELDDLAGLRAEPFLDDELVGIAAPGTLAHPAAHVDARFLAGQTLLVREQGSSTRRTADTHLARAGIRFAKHWELDSNEAIKRAVAAGLGVGFLSRLVVADELARGDLSAFRLAGAPPMTRSIVLLRPDDRRPTPSERAFTATLAECCAGWT